MRPTAAVHGGEAIGSGGSKEIRFRGVRKRSWGRYDAEINDPWKKTRVWLGTFDSAEDTARAYDADARSLHGPKVYGTCPRSDSYTLTFQCRLICCLSFRLVFSSNFKGN
ncbi:hypothetical protein ACS0TY_010100 [Phlomoides rotata]